MSSNTQPMYGMVSINGQNFIERWQVIPFQIAVTVSGQLINQSCPLPGVYDFRLKGLTRATTINTAGVISLSALPFLFQLGNSDGDINYSQGGLGSTTDLVLDSLVFGNGQFPYAVIPPIYYGKNAAIKVKIQDITNNATVAPFNIIFAFHGSYLIPTQ